VPMRRNFDRQLLLVQQLIHEEPAEGNFRRSRKVQIVFLLASTLMDTAIARNNVSGKSTHGGGGRGRIRFGGNVVRTSTP